MTKKEIIEKILDGFATTYTKTDVLAIFKNVKPYDQSRIVDKLNDHAHLINGYFAPAVDDIKIYYQIGVDSISIASTIFSLNLESFTRLVISLFEPSIPNDIITKNELVELIENNYNGISDEHIRVLYEYFSSVLSCQVKILDVVDNEIKLDIKPNFAIDYYKLYERFN